MKMQHCIPIRHIPMASTLGSMPLTARTVPTVPTENVAMTQSWTTPILIPHLAVTKVTILDREIAPCADRDRGSLQCGVYKSTNVISLSYGGQEFYIPSYYQKRQCNEYLKLGLQG